MSEQASGLLTVAVLVAALAAVHVPLGDYIARVFSSDKDLAVERAFYRLSGVNPQSQQRWSRYAVSVLAFSGVSVVALWALCTWQGRLPLDRGATMDWHTAINTAISFVTNTNWQSYAGESGASALVQTLGLAVQNFVSAAVGIAVAVALIRGLVARRTGLLGNFWVDLTRATVRLLLPIAFLGAVLLLAGGVIQDLAAPQVVETITGGHQTIESGLVSSQEAIKLLGTNGGGFFNANSAHPFENPNGFTNLVEIFLILMIPFSLPRAYGRLVGDKRQGYAVLGFMAFLWTSMLVVITWAEQAAAGSPTGAMEGKEVRFGVWSSALFATSTTATSTGAVDSWHESFSPIGGGGALTNMLLGEVGPGGVGSGLYGALVVAILAVFIAGLMVGRTPEILGKQVGRKEITYAALYSITTPALVLLGTGAALLVSGAKGAILATGPHGLTEILYAYASASNNNGSAFGGLSADQPYLNLTLGACMLLGRFLPIIAVLALAGSFAAQHRRPTTDGTMPTHTPLFAGLMVGVALLVTGLTFLPVLALGPLAEALS
ncbi:potassium-transporting ATPase potassium-binding subunit [Flexivirga endophytica]|uniref:Potassium-transporting ATPase potassium-binding subunit n=1 Tax=Flexivirga endophytica TaxID=1849103 RepID=A0A916SUE5_9MICO|nr:potassium-transporting ATPase subunit KdpA [Flexivirga endophytica]GGB17213.1 potassium-transporting ATPase potassium-binding subunit [Flexivirga endophytica]GHB38380.1 potassium-transporting ATPase potassium-binding subunit [Flexivirga endophytica]